jgi:hypothetical protein
MSFLLSILITIMTHDLDDTPAALRWSPEYVVLVACDRPAYQQAFGILRFTATTLLLEAPLSGQFV